MKKNCLRFITFHLVLTLCISSFTVFATESSELIEEVSETIDENSESTSVSEETSQEVINVTENQKLELTLEPTKENSIILKWNEIENASGYQVYQKETNSIENFQSISTVDINDKNLKINVLNIYPKDGNKLKNWITNYSKELIYVEEISMKEFNKDTSILKTEDGNWKYDVIVFGFKDCNGEEDLNENSLEIVKEFINDGKGVIFGHDTIYDGNPNFASLKDYLKITLSESLKKTSKIEKFITVENTGLLTSYPWDFNTIKSTIDISDTHPNGQTTDGDKWFKLGETDSIYNSWNFYMTTNNNCIFTQLGHSDDVTEDEQKLIVNAIIYCHQITKNTSFTDLSAQDKGYPEIPTISVDVDNKEIKLVSNDIGTDYTYYVKANIGKDNVLSEEKTVTITSGIKGYYYFLDNKAFTDFEVVDNVKFTESSFPADELIDNTYLHVYAIDKANNTSSVAHIRIDELPEIAIQPKSVTIHGVEHQKAIFETEGKGSYITYQWQIKENETWKDIENATNKTYQTDIITTENKDNIYRCKISNDSTFIYTDEVGIEFIDVSVFIPTDFNINGNDKKGKFKIETKGAENFKLSVEPQEQVLFKLNNTENYGIITKENDEYIISLNSSLDGVWKGFTTFQIIIE